jgi:aminopeptidase-like protein
MLSKRGLYSFISKKDSWKSARGLLDILQFSDGRNSIEKISKYTNIKRSKLNNYIKILKKFNLIEI